MVIFRVLTRALSIRPNPDLLKLPVKRTVLANLGESSTTSAVNEINNLGKYTLRYHIC